MTYARHNPYDLDAEELHAGPAAFVCPCCGESGFIREEIISPEQLSADYADAVARQFAGDPICAPCADDLAICEGCYAVTTDPTLTDRATLCDDCAADDPIVRAENAADDAHDAWREGV